MNRGLSHCSSSPSSSSSLFFIISPIHHLHWFSLSPLISDLVFPLLSLCDRIE
ncbi:hypothetical protein Scep_010042 [Stephania cephalantha]|uniref:Uncharacterized protein n=1 Tax=Stephania cephalantha TaxID=152367 RepID=A0AAP0JU92_9MAGN